MELGRDRHVDCDDVRLIGQLQHEAKDVLSSPRWQIAESDVIDWREWGDEFVVHVASRSETHLLSAATGTILLSLLDGRQALSLDAMYALAIDDAEIGASSKDSIMSAAARESLQVIVAELERLGILRAA